MLMLIPEKDLLKKTGEVDYYDWNYKFPIKYISRYRFKKLIRLLGSKHYPAMLEIGTGSGIFIPELAKHCTRLFATDIHFDLDNIHRLCNHYQITNCELSTQSIEATNFPDDYFDVIIGVSVLEFVPDLAKAFMEIKRILKPDGIFLTICPMHSKFLDSILGFYTRKKPEEEFGSTRKEVGKSLESNFKVLEKGYMLPLIGRWFPVYTHYKLGK
jgi:ubiquinone/menaquinone biosynthesis C-methylase UbiE